MSKGANKGKMQDVFGYINRNAGKPKQIVTDLREQGSLVNIETMKGKELAMVLRYISKKELKKYLEDHNISYDKNSEIWERNYAVLGHFKAEDIKTLIEENKYDESPKLNLLIVLVYSKTTYSVIAGTTPEMQLLFEILQGISKADKEIPSLINKLLNVSAMNLATKDMSKSYQEELEKKRLEEQSKEQSKTLDEGDDDELNKHNQESEKPEKSE